MGGGMGWGRWAVVGGLVMGCCAGAWAANPDGPGTLHLELGGMTQAPGESGTYAPPAPTPVYHLYDQAESDDAVGVNGTFALAPALSGDLAADFEQAVADNGQYVNATHYFDVQDLTQALHVGVGTRLYVASLFGRDWNAETDHPEGAVGWPVLWLRADWNQGNSHPSLLDKRGFNVTLAPDLAQQSAFLALGLILPLDQQCELFGSYDRNVASMAEQGNASASNQGSSDTFDLGGSYHFLFWDPDPTQAYFPRVGRPGQVLLSADVFSTRAIAQDANLAAGMGASATVPLGCVAVELDWNWSHAYRQPYDGLPSFTPTFQGQDSQHVTLRVGYAFGSAAPAAAQPAAADDKQPSATLPPAALASPDNGPASGSGTAIEHTASASAIAAALEGAPVSGTASSDGTAPASVTAASAETGPVTGTAASADAAPASAGTTPASGKSAGADTTPANGTPSGAAAAPATQASSPGDASATEAPPAPSPTSTTNP
jgi:hypothetical protein